MILYPDKNEISKLSHELTDNGFVKLEKIIDHKHCQELIAICEANYEKHKNSYAKNKQKKHRLNDNSSEKLVYNLYNKDEKFLNLIDVEPIYNLCKKQLNRGSFNPDEPITLRQMTARCPSDKQNAQKLHIDSRHLGGKYPFLLVAIMALDPFTKANGATRLVPKSHLFDAFPPDDDPEEVQAVEMCPGDVLIFNGNLWHGGGANISGVRRWGLLLTFTRWFYKPAFQHDKIISAELQNSLNQRQKELLGLNSIPPLDEFDRLEAIKDFV